MAPGTLSRSVRAFFRAHLCGPESAASELYPASLHRFRIDVLEQKRYNNPFISYSDRLGRIPTLADARAGRVDQKARADRTQTKHANAHRRDHSANADRTQTKHPAN